MTLFLFRGDNTNANLSYTFTEFRALAFPGATFIFKIANSPGGYQVMF